MPEPYRDRTDLYNEITQVANFDLLPHAYAMDKELSQILLQPKPGIYLGRGLDPVFAPGDEYILFYEDLRQKTSNETPIQYQDVLSDFRRRRRLPPGHFYTMKRRLLMNREAYNRYHSSMTESPDFPVVACEAAVAMVLNVLNDLQPKYTFVPRQRYDLHNLVREDCHHLLTIDRINFAFPKLYEELYDFVGKDTYHLYRYKIFGTTLSVIKGMDYRILKWYEGQMKKTSQYDHDFGGPRYG